MSQSYSREFKAQVVMEATSGESSDPVKVAEKHGVTKEQIVEWAASMDIDNRELMRLARAAGVDSDDLALEVDLTSGSERFESDISYGVSHDIIDMKRLGYWTTYGTVFVILIVVALIFTYQFTTSQTIQQVYEQSGGHYEVSELKENDRQRLSSFGVVDADQEIYRVPIDLVMEQMARDEQEQ